VADQPRGASKRVPGSGTTAVHGAPRRASGSLVAPVVQTSTFVFDSSAQMRRYLAGADDLYLYTRYENPTLRALEQALAALEGAEDALVLASGMAASTTALLSLLEPCDEIVASASLYGGTTKLIRNVLGRLGFRFQLVPPAELPQLERIAGERARLVVLESPTNPNVDVVDIAAVTRAARARGIRVMVDNTFATPILQRPLELGADLVMHSLTKALSGHSDILGGALVGPHELVDRARQMLKVLGGCLDPHAAFLALRGLKTVHLRVERQCRNAQALAEHLSGHPKITRVLYPGLPSHPGHAIAAKQMRGRFGGIVSFVLAGGLEAAERFYDALRLVARAASLGGVETLVSLPLHTSHHGYTPEQLKAAGVDPGMVRVSLGVEDEQDVIADVSQALDAA
jgi:cystathionine beta-lyase/cystathionine gamma-synthase